LGAVNVDPIRCDLSGDMAIPSFLIRMSQSPRVYFPGFILAAEIESVTAMAFLME